MALMSKRKTRMYEPWGYREENNYQSSENIREDDLSSFFADVEYKRDDNKIHFSNKDGEEVGTLNVDDFIKSDQIVEKAWYENGNIYIKFTNGDLITIDVKELLDENEFKDGLQVIDGVVSVLRDPQSERWLTVSSNGVKVDGIQAEIDRLDGRIDDEIARATSEEQRIEAKLDQEIQDRKDDVDTEEARATGEEQRIEAKLDAEITRSKDTDDALDTRIGILNDALTSEKAAREASDLSLSNMINGEQTRATSAETILQNSLNAEISARETTAFANAEYDESGKTINFKNVNGAVISSIDATPFLKDGMIDDVKIENGKLVIVFNTDAGKETVEIPLSDIFDPSNYYTKAETDENIASETTARETGDNTLEGEITALSAIVAAKANTTDVDDALALKADKTEIPTDFYTKAEVDSKDAALQDAIDAESARAISAETDIEVALSGKADADTVYTQSEVDELLSAKETEIYNLTKIVGDMGGAVTYELPGPSNKSFNTLMNNNGTVKITDDVTTGRFGPGITAKNNVKLNLNNHNLNVTGLTTSSAQPAIMSRGTQEITIYGNGTIDAGGGICIEANGKDSVINLTGSTTVYQTNRPGAELIYCYAGTINITNGTFKNNGSPYLLNCYDANYNNGTAKIIVTGGKFYDFNPADNSAEGEHTSFVPEGYHVETSTVIEEEVEHTVYTVKKDA